MKTKALILTSIFFTCSACCGQIFAADKVVVIPLMSKAKAITCTPQYENIPHNLSIPGAAFLFEVEDDTFFARRQSLGGASKGLFAHSDSTTSHPIVAPIYFPSEAQSIVGFGFAICGNSNTTGSTVTADLMERSMISGSTSQVISYTIDNSSGDKGCHILYGTVSPTVHFINNDENTYYLSIYGLEGGGEFDAKRTELDYVRITYYAKEIKQFTCQ